jgi:nucleotide-binding universal stress UspA family protein
VFLNILVAIDDSAHAARALDEALDLARAQRSRLTIIAVASRPAWRYMAGPYAGMMPTQEETDAAAEKTIAAARERAGADIPVTTVVGRGSTAEAILARAREGDHDLGSVSHHVLHHGRVPVLIVHAHRKA